MTDEERHQSPCHALRALLREARPYVASAKGDDTETHNFVDGLLRDIDAALAQSDAEPVRVFAKTVLHGDDEHKAWLTEAAEAFIAGRPLPVPRGKGTAPPRPDAFADRSGK